MASKRHQRRRACEGKVAHATKDAALLAAAKLRKNHLGGSWSVYRCEWCGRFHVGRQNARDRRAMAARRALAAE